MIVFKIIDEADQSFGAILNGRRVSLRLRYSPTTDRWSLDLSIDDLPVLHGRRVVIGADLLEPFDFGIGEIWAVPVKPEYEPDRTSLPLGNVRLFHLAVGERPN